MPKAILISIHPQYVQKILEGSKTIEIRKTKPKCELPCKVYIYCTKEKTSLPILKDIGGYAGSYEAGGHHANFIHVNKKHFLYGNKERCYFDTLDCDRLPRMKERCNKLNGKVVAEFTLNKVDLLVDVGGGIHFADKDYNLKDQNELLKKSCLKEEDIYNYLGRRKDNKAFFNDGYAWHIDNIKIYDKPKELSEFRKDLDCDDYPCNKGGKGSDCKYYYYDISEGCSACGIDFDGEHCIYKTIKRPPQSYMYVMLKN